MPCLRGGRGRQRTPRGGAFGGVLGPTNIDTAAMLGRGVSQFRPPLCPDRRGRTASTARIEHPAPRQSRTVRANRNLETESRFQSNHAATEILKASLGELRVSDGAGFSDGCWRCLLLP